MTPVGRRHWDARWRFRDTGKTGTPNGACPVLTVFFPEPFTLSVGGCHEPDPFSQRTTVVAAVNWGCLAHHGPEPSSKETSEAPPDDRPSSEDAGKCEPSAAPLRVLSTQLGRCQLWLLTLGPADAGARDRAKQLQEKCA